VAKNYSSLFLTTFYVEILRIQRATYVPNVTEWLGLGWTTPFAAEGPKEAKADAMEGLVNTHVTGGRRSVIGGNIVAAE
jgi:hypothetical protein